MDANMDTAAPPPEIRDEEIEPQRRRCLLRGILDMGLFAAFSLIGVLPGTSHHSPVTKVLIAVGGCLGLMGIGYLMASDQWRKEERAKCLEHERLRRLGQVRRVALKRSAGLDLLVVSLIGAALITWDLGWRHTPAGDYLRPALLIGLATAARLWLDGRTFEADYLAATSEPPPQRTLWQDLKDYWHVGLMLLLMNWYGFLKPIGLILIFLACHYPLEKWKAKRSRQEFGELGPQGS